MCVERAIRMPLKLICTISGIFYTKCHCVAGTCLLVIIIIMLHNNYAKVARAR